MLLIVSGVLLLSTLSTGQRITTIQLDGVQYFISRMNPYSPELNYFLAYQYCRSLGLQLASFETKEKADSISQYLTNAGYTKYDFWTSGNKLGTDMYLWMSTGLPFNATFNYMRKHGENAPPLILPSAGPQRVSRETFGYKHECVALKAPTMEWDVDDCTTIKDFICEQTRCYYYNYGSIPVSSSQGKPLVYTTIRPFSSSSSSSSTSSPVASTQSPLTTTASADKLNIINSIQMVSNSVTSSDSHPHPHYTENSDQGEEEADSEFATVGPYSNKDQFAADMQNDEPYQAPEEEYVSTIIPQTD